MQRESNAYVLLGQTRMLVVSILLTLINEPMYKEYKNDAIRFIAPNDSFEQNFFLRLFRRSGRRN